MQSRRDTVEVRYEVLCACSRAVREVLQRLWNKQVGRGAYRRNEDFHTHSLSLWSRVSLEKSSCTHIEPHVFSIIFDSYQISQSISFHFYSDFRVTDTHVLRYWGSEREGEAAPSRCGNPQDDQFHYSCISDSKVRPAGIYFFGA